MIRTKEGGKEEGTMERKWLNKRKTSDQEEGRKRCKQGCDVDVKKRENRMEREAEGNRQKERLNVSLIQQSDKLVEKCTVDPLVSRQQSRPKIVQDPKQTLIWEALLQLKPSSTATEIMQTEQINHQVRLVHMLFYAFMFV